MNYETYIYIFTMQKDLIYDKKCHCYRISEMRDKQKEFSEKDKIMDLYGLSFPIIKICWMRSILD